MEPILRFWLILFLALDPIYQKIIYIYWWNIMILRLVLNSNYAIFNNNQNLRICSDYSIWWILYLKRLRAHSIVQPSTAYIAVLIKISIATNLTSNTFSIKAMNYVFVNVHSTGRTTSNAFILDLSKLVSHYFYYWY